MVPVTELSVRDGAKTAFVSRSVDRSAREVKCDECGKRIDFKKGAIARSPHDMRLICMACNDVLVEARADLIATLRSKPGAIIKRMKKRSEVKKSKEAMKSAAERTAPMFDGGVEVTKCRACGERVRADDVKSKNTAGEPECPDCGAPIKFTGETAPKTEDKIIPDREKANEKAIADSKISTAVSGKFCPKCGDQWPIIKGELFPNCGHTGTPVDDPSKAERVNPAAGHQRYLGGGGVGQLEVSIPVSTFVVDRGADIRVGGFKATINISGDGGEEGSIPVVGRKIHKELLHLAKLAFEDQLEWYLECSDKLRKRLENE